MTEAQGNHQLSMEQIDTLRRVLARIEQVGLFGSRATGRARANSDIDVVLYGVLDEALVDRIWTLCDESDLALKVDVNAYELIEHSALKAHIDQVMQPLFSREELQGEKLSKKARGTHDEAQL